MREPDYNTPKSIFCFSEGGDGENVWGADVLSAAGGGQAVYYLGILAIPRTPKVKHPAFQVMGVSGRFVILPI